MNNVYIRSKNSIYNISKWRLISLILLIVYGVYENGYKFYKGYENVSFMYIFRPLIFIFIGVLIGIVVNLIFTKKEKKMSLSDMLFSSFHIEYGAIIGCLMSNSVSILVFTLVTSALFVISKLIDIKINVVALDFIVIYVLTNVLGNGFSYNELINTTITTKGYLVGNVPGGVCATSFIALLISYLILKIQNSSKTDITLLASFSYAIPALIYSYFNNIPLLEMITINSIFFTFVYVVTDSVSSSYTLKGTKAFGIIVGLLTFIIYFINPILAPFIAILVTSLFHVVIDKICNKFRSKN